MKYGVNISLDILFLFSLKNPQHFLMFYRFSLHFCFSFSIVFFDHKKNEILV